jgi:hypothetical protein
LLAPGAMKGGPEAARAIVKGARVYVPPPPEVASAPPK